MDSNCRGMRDVWLVRETYDRGRQLLKYAAPLILFSASPATAGDALPNEENISALVEKATRIFLETDTGADGAEAIIAAWEDVREAAARNDPDHPEIARADIRIAAQLYTLGRNSEARSKVEAGLSGLPAEDAAYIVARAEGLALLGTLMAQAGEADGAIGALQAGYDAFTVSYSQLDPETVSRGEVLAKSNLEFSLSQVFLRISKLEEALRFQMASLTTREAFLGPNDPDTISSYYGYAGALRRAGQMEEAERFARIAVTRAVDHIAPSHPSYARALEMLAIVLSRSGRPIEATDYLSRALELKREHEGADSLFFGYGIHQLASILHQRERYEDAVPLFLEAAPVFAKYQGEDSPFGLGSLAYAAQGEFALGREARALSRLQALDTRLGEDSRDLEITQRIGPDLVRALIRDGQSDKAARIARRDYGRLAEAEDGDAFGLRHASLVDKWAQANLGQELILAANEARAMLGFFERAQIRELAGFLEVEHRAALDLVMEIAIASDDNDLLAQAIALGTGSGIAQATALRAERFAAHDPQFAQAMRALQNAEAEVDAADRALLRAISSGDALSEHTERLGAANVARNLALDEVRMLGGNLDGFNSVRAVSISSIRTLLKPGEAILAIAPVYDGAYSLLVTQEEAIGQRIAIPRAKLVAMAQRVRDGAASVQFDQVEAQALGAYLMGPDALDALEGTQVLRLVAGGELASFPFGILPIAARASDPASDKDTSHVWLTDLFALANAASLDNISLAPVGGRNDGAAPKTEGDFGQFVAFAAPTPFGEPAVAANALRSVGNPASYFERSGANAGRLASLPPLPQSEQEARTIAAEFGEQNAKVFVGDAANERNLSDPSVAMASVILFATHGLVGGEVEGIAEPALILAKPDPASQEDGVLSASEITRLNLSADWVILTACDSAAGFSGGLPAFSGLVSAFRFAGGGSLLATHWKVRDDVAAYVAIETLRHYRIYGNKALALHHAIRNLRMESGLPGADRPDIWGPFVLIE